MAALLGTVRDFAGQPLGAVEIIMDAGEYGASLRRAGWLTGGIAVGGVLVAALAGLLLARTIARPIRLMTAAMGRLAQGDHDIALPRTRIAEVGRMAEAMQVFRGNAVAQRQAEERKDMEQRALEARRAALTRMAETIEEKTSEALDEVGRRTGAVAGVATEMGESATRTSHAAEAAAGAAKVALENAQTVANAAEQLAASIHEIGAQAGQSAAIAARAVAAGRETRAAIEAMNGRVSQIGAVADMIADIAARTNLLALNATIEAARAGDAGRGFAVVAGEVKQLAGQTARATGEIGQRITEVLAATSASVGAVGQIERTIAEIDGLASSIAAAVKEQGAATAEIARNVAETAGAARDMRARTDEVATEAEQTGRQAAVVGKEAEATAAATGSLREAVIRAVRTSSGDVDRRRHARIDTDMPARVRLDDGRAFNARAADVSPGGARLVGPVPLASPGTSGKLWLKDRAAPLAFTVRAVEDGRMRIAFAADDCQATLETGLLTT